jgi:hypothetical protein
MKREADEKNLRISYLVKRSDLPRLEWMMAATGVSTKAGLIRAALKYLEDQTVQKAAKQAEQRRRVGAPALPPYPG